MNRKFLFFLLALHLILPEAYPQNEDPSTEEIIEALRSEEGVSLTPPSQFFTDDDLCLPHNTLIDNAKDLCEAAVASPACQELDENQRMDCETEQPSEALNFWHFAKGCGSGVFQSVKAFLGFIWDRVKWLWRNSTSQQARSESYEQASEYMNSVNLYLNTEYEKAYGEVSSPFRKTKALARMSMAIGEELLSSVMDLISQRFEAIGCMSVQARSEVICQFLGEIFVPPVSGLVLLRYGIRATGKFPNLARAFDKLDSMSPRTRRASNRARLNEAESLLGRNLDRNQRDAVIQAHEVGRGEVGRDGTPARIGNYTQAHLHQKARILKEQGFREGEIRTLMENGIVGLSEVESRGFMGIVADIFRRNPPPPPSPADIARVNPPVRIAPRRARPVAPPTEAIRYRYKGREYSIDPPPNTPRENVWPARGNQVAVPRSSKHGGGFTNGEIIGRNEDGSIQVAFKNAEGKWGEKPLDPDRLFRPVSSDLHHINIETEVSIPRRDGSRSNGEITAIRDDWALVSWDEGDKWVRFEFLDTPVGRGFEVARRRGLTPRESIGRIPGADDIQIGKFFQDSGGRIFTIAKVTVDGQSSHRVFYRSNSQTMFRLLPARNERATGMPGYDKGPEEDTLTLSSEIQAALSERARSLDRRSLDTLDSKELDGIIPINRNRNDYQNYERSSDYVGRTVSQRTILQDREVSLRDGYGRHFAEPEDMHIRYRNNQPNYETPIRTYQVDPPSPVYGNVTAYVYPSHNDRLEYTLLRDQSGKVWFGDIGYRVTPLSPHGLRRDAIDSEGLTMPLWEYEDGIPRGYGGRNERPRGRRGEYSSAWNYIREIPEIQRWYRENNLPIPR